MNKAGFNGRIVDVRFIETNSKLAAISQEFEKIAFLDRFCRIAVTPQSGEDWQCVVRGDSNRNDPKRGALFLKPIRKLTETMEWSVEDQHGSAIGNVFKPKVVRKVMFGKKHVSKHEWSPANRSGIETDWPDWVKSLVLKRFSDFERVRRSSARSAKLDSMHALRELLIIPEAEFQWVGNGEWLTNGDIWLPRERPCGSEWRHYPIPAISEQYWRLFLAGLEGKVVVDLIPFRQEILSQGARRESALTKRQTRLTSLIAAHMWNGTEDCKRVSFGRNVIFIVDKLDGKAVYIVDNPGTGAIYLFEEYETAMSLANGSLRRSRAIKDGVTRLTHQTGWEQKLAALLK